MNQNEYYTLPNAMAKLGVTYKTIRYYAEHELFANDESLVRFEGKKKWVSEKFIEKVRHNLETNSSRFKDPRTKDELIGEVERLNGLYNEATKKYFINYSQGGELKTELPYIIHWADHMSCRVESGEYKTWSDNYKSK